MKEKILEIIQDKVELSLSGNYKSVYIDGADNAAKEIASHIMEFIEWIGENNTKEPKWRAFLLDLLGTKSYTTEELYQYWLNNVKK